MRNMFIVRDGWKIELNIAEGLGGNMGETHYQFQSTPPCVGATWVGVPVVG